MGTNYYIEFDVCEKCGRAKDSYHIGKSSAGWCFSLHVDSYAGVMNLGDMREKWKGQIIKDENGSVHSEKGMLDIILNRGSDKPFESKPISYKSWDQFHSQNYSEFGPKNLLRHRIDNTHCIGHGEGTYDYITGEFS